MPKIVTLLALIPLLAACGTSDPAPGAGATSVPDSAEDAAAGTAAGAGLQVVASVWPLAWAAKQIAPDAEVTLLNAGGAEAHDIEITPTQRAAIETADAVLYMGDIDYQPQVEQAVAAAQGDVVDVAAVAGEQRLLKGAADPHAHDEGEDQDSSDEPGDATEDGRSDEGGAVDPHVWFDMDVMADVAAATAEAFVAAAPQDTEAFTANAEELTRELRRVDAELDALLDNDCRFDEVIISHVAYAYLTEPRGKELHGITGIDPEGGASAAALADLVAEVREEGFDYVVAEPVEGRADAEVLAREAGVDLLDIYPLDAVTDEQAATSFPELVLQQAQTLSTAYGCS